VFFEDLTPYSIDLTTPLEEVQNVGWLEGDKHFEKGTVDPALLKKLGQIVFSSGATDFRVNRIRGSHPCSLSPSHGVVRLPDGHVLGSCEIWIPKPDEVSYFAAPSLIYHYIEAHSYKPPDEFLEAVAAIDLSAPFTGQEKYLEKIAGHF
jgi:hypothetical protein